MIHMTPININVLTIEFAFDSMIRVYLCFAFYFRTNFLMNLVRFYINRPEVKFTFLQVPMCPCVCFHLFFYRANHSRMKTTAKFSASFYVVNGLVDFRGRKEVIGVQIFRSPPPTYINHSHNFEREVPSGGDHCGFPIRLVNLVLTRVLFRYSNHLIMCTCIIEKTRFNFGELAI